MRISLFLLLLFPVLSHSLNLLFYLSIVGKSHLNFVSSLIDILVDRGHHVDLLLSRLNPSVQWQNTSKARRVLSFTFPGDESPWMRQTHLNNPFEKYETFDMWTMNDVTTRLCEIALQSPSVPSFLLSGSYDAMIVSDYDWCGHILSHSASIPSLISYTATDFLISQAYSIGLPSPVSAVTGRMHVEDFSFSLLSKLKRLVRSAYYVYGERPAVAAAQNAVARRYLGPSFPDVQLLARNVDLVLVNSHEILQQPLVLSHKVKFIGGIGMRDTKALSQDYDRLLGNKKVVVFSLGTQVPSANIPKEIRSIILNSFRQFSDFLFVWNYERQEGDEKDFEGIENVVTRKRIPQADLLHDPRVVLFISHVGLNSYLEAGSAGVPILAIPLFADQSYNAQAAVHLGVAVALDKTRLSVERMTKGLREMLYNESYSMTARRISLLMKGTQKEMERRFVESVEMVATHGPTHQIFNLYEADLGAWEYYCFDLFTILLISLFFSIYVIYRIIRTIYYRICAEKHKVE